MLEELGREGRATSRDTSCVRKTYLVAAALIDGMPFQGLLCAARAVWVRVLDQRLQHGRVKPSVNIT